MKNSICMFKTAFAILFLSLATTAIAQEKSIRETYRGVDEVKINIAAGSLNVEKSTTGSVEVMGTYDDKLEVKIEQNGSTLNIQEKGSRRSNDGSRWTLKLPANVDFSSNIGAGDANISGSFGEMTGNIGAGSYRLENVSGKIRLNTGTGDIYLSDASGDLNVNSGTGNVMIKNLDGAISANSGTGDVKAEDVAITGKSSLNSGTGNVSLRLGKKPLQADLSINSGTDDSVLDLNGQSFDGVLTMKCDKKRGEISAPFSFDEEETEGSGRNETLRKTKKFGNSGVEVRVSSGTGTAKVIK